MITVLPIRAFFPDEDSLNYSVVIKEGNPCLVIKFGTPNEFAHFSQKQSTFPKYDKNKRFLDFCLVYIPLIL